MYTNGIKSYRKTNVITADPGRLVTMCYEGAIENLIIAKQKYAEKKYEDKCKALIKARDIIDELLCSLDFEKGGSTARALESLYNYMQRRLIAADVKHDLTAFDEVIGMLKELLSAWEEVFSKQNKKIQPAMAGFDGDRKMQSRGSMAL